jgi:glycosyltransferase involved in cell wall biosynthesis
MQNKIKSITVITNNYPSSTRMDYVFVQQLVHAIIEQGVKVTVIAPQSIVYAILNRRKILSYKSKGVTSLGKIYNIYRPYTITILRFKYLKQITDWFTEKIIAFILKKINNEIIYSHFWNGAALTYKFTSTNKLPLFVACGESGDHFESTVKLFSKTTLENMSKVVTGVISVSSENKRLCIDNNLVKEDDIEVIPNCINADAFCKRDVTEFRSQLGISESDFVIAFVGGFIPRKGPDRLAEAISKLNDPQIKVMFIGKPFPGFPYEFNCSGIIHKGTIEHDVLPKYLNCADVFVLPTQTEGCCNAIVEALAIGLPVVSYVGAFNDDILDENNSIRIDPNDVDAIANAIKTLKDNPKLRKRMSEYSISRHAEYSIEGRAKKILNFIQRKISKQ